MGFLVVLLVWLTIGFERFSAFAQVNFQATPATFKYGVTKKLQLLCSVNETLQSSITVKAIQIKHQRNYMPETIVEIRDIYKTAQVIAEDCVRRSEAIGSLGLASSESAYLRIVMTELTLGDSGRYTCEIDYQGRNYPRQWSSNLKLVAQATPESIKMITFPDRKAYSVGQNIIIRCLGNIEYQPYNELKWSWEQRHSDADIWTIYQHHSFDYFITPVYDNYKFPGVTSITHKVGESDDGMTFRCVLGNTTAYSASKTIYLTDDAKVPWKRPDGKGSRHGINTSLSDTCDGMVPVHVPAVVGVIPGLVILVTFGVYVLIEWKRKGKNETPRTASRGKRKEKNEAPSTASRGKRKGKTETPSTADRGHDPFETPMYHTLTYDGHQHYARSFAVESKEYNIAQC